MSAADKSRPLVRALGTATQKIFAAFAGSDPIWRVLERDRLMGRKVEFTECLNVEVRGWLRPESTSRALDAIEALCESEATKMPKNP